MGTFPIEEMPRVTRARGAQIMRNATGLVRTASAVLVEDLVRETPVDEGIARSNWVGRLNNPFLGQIAPYSRLPKGTNLAKKFETANAAAAIAQNKFHINKFNAKKDRGFYVSNGVRDEKTGESYIGILNQTTRSKQTRPGFVQRAIQRARRSIRGRRILR